MTNDEREELNNAIAQARGAQSVLQALLISIVKRGDRVLVEEAFHIAGEVYTVVGLSTNEKLAAEATRVLQVIDHMRQSTIGHDAPRKEI